MNPNIYFCIFFKQKSPAFETLENNKHVEKHWRENLIETLMHHA